MELTKIEEYIHQDQVHLSSVYRIIYQRQNASLGVF